jgi:hypothetical protein
MWLLRATGDPNRRIKIEEDQITRQDILRSASTFHFPACDPCNKHYGKKLEARAKVVIETVAAGRSLEVSQCYCLLDWLDKVRVGLWLAYNTLHQEEFEPKFRIDQRIGIKDRIAIVRVDPDDRSKGLGFGGLNNQIFRTSQAGMFLHINNIKILSISFDGLISRFAGIPYPKEMFIASDTDRDQHLVANIGCSDYCLKQDWKEFGVPGATIISQSSFWFGNCLDKELKRIYLNKATINRFKHFPKVRKLEDLYQFVPTHLISNSSGVFRYYESRRSRVKFGKAQENTDFNFVKALYSVFLLHVLPLNPKRVIDPDGTKRGIIVLGMLWLEKAVQILFRLRKMGISDEQWLSLMVDELLKVYRLREESVVHLEGTRVPDAVLSW